VAFAFMFSLYYTAGRTISISNRPFSLTSNRLENNSTVTHIADKKERNGWIENRKQSRDIAI
jgi:DNA-binding MarR family transcriptional regulator